MIGVAALIDDAVKEASAQFSGGLQGGIVARQRICCSASGDAGEHCPEFSPECSAGAFPVPFPDRRLLGNREVAWSTLGLDSVCELLRMRSNRTARRCRHCLSIALRGRDRCYLPLQDFLAKSSRFLTGGGCRNPGGA